MAGKYLTVFVLVICWIAILDAKSNNSTLEKYTIVSHDGTFITHRDCPFCHLGQGLTVQCGSVIKIGTEIDCKLCVANETFNDEDKPTKKLCSPCETHQNRDILENCTPTQNRKYGNCSKGFYLSKITKDCMKCSCCPKGDHDKNWVEKCANDDMPENMQCEESNIRCSVSTPPTQQVSMETTNIEGTTKPPVTSNSTKTRANNPETTKLGSEKSTPTGAPVVNAEVTGKEASNRVPVWALIGIALFIPVAAIVIGIVLWYRHPRARNRDGIGNIESQEIGFELQPRSDGQQPSSTRRETSGCNLFCSYAPLRAIIEDSKNLLNDSPEPSSVGDLSCSADGSYNDEEEPQDLVAEEQESNNSGNNEEINFPECKCSKMDYYLQQHLVKKLDIEKRSQANWYDVGIKFKIPKDDLESFRLEYKKDGGSPTNCLLETLETRGEDEPTVKDFVTVLQGLGRNDIICSWDWVNNQKKN